MSEESGLYAVYADSDIAPPTSEYWRQRRNVAAEIRTLQENLQTTELTSEELSSLTAELQTLQRRFDGKPRLRGRSEWVQRNQYGSWGILQTEVTPIMGPSNPISPELSIWFEKDVAYARVTFGWRYEGADHIAHGGWVAAVFDEFLGTAQVLSGRTGMTVSLTTRYHKPTPLNRELRLQANVKSIDDRKIIMTGEMHADDVLTASCEGLFIVPDDNRISKAFR